MPAPQAKRQPSTSLAQKSFAPDSPQKVIADIAREIKNLPGVNFTLINSQTPNSLPQSCAKILHRENLLDQEGQVVAQSLPLLRQENFVRQLSLKLVYAVVKSDWQQHLFQIADLISRTQPEKYQRHLLAFSRLFADHYSYFPTNSILQDRYAHLVSPRLALNRLPHQKAIDRAQKNLYDQLLKEKKGLIASIHPFFQAAEDSAREELGQKLTEELIDRVKDSEIVLPLLKVNIDHSVFPQINLSYTFPEN